MTDTRVPTGEHELPDDLRATERQLRRALHRFDCPTTLTLGDYELDLLAPEQRTSVAAHVVDCPRCGDELRTLRTFVRERHEPTSQIGPIERVRRIVASALAPGAGTAYAGLRGAAANPVQTYRADDYGITLGPGIETRLGRASVMGLIVQEGVEATAPFGAEVHLLREVATASGAASYVTQVDQLGNFAFDDVDPGTYALELHLGDHLVVVENVAVGG